jgi:hypothetical protein
MAAEMSNVLAEEQMILEDIFRRTGLRFRKLGGIDRNDREVMQQILPIVKVWIASSSGPVRGALYFQFLTPAALPYLEDVLAWAAEEKSAVDREVLTQILRLIVTPKTAKRIWEVFQRLDPTGSDPLLLSKLVNAASVSDEVAERIMQFLNLAVARIDHGELVRTFARGPLQEYSRVRHPKVKAWFQQYLQSADPDLRAMARRSSRIKSVLPAGCRVVRGAADRSRLVLSTEIDSDRLVDFLRELDRDLGAEFLFGIQPDQVVENLTERKWFVSDATHSKRGPLELWLRLEDAGTTEAWVVGPGQARPN